MRVHGGKTALLQELAAQRCSHDRPGRSARDDGRLARVPAKLVHRTDDSAMESLTRRAAGPNAKFHAVRLSDAYEGTALCGAPVQVWPRIKFPSPLATGECESCRDAVRFET